MFEISNMPNLSKFWAFYFGTNLGLTIGKYFIKIICGIKIEIGTFEISNVTNLNKFEHF